MKYTFLASFILAVVLSGCGEGNQILPVSPSPTPPEIMADCFQYFHLYAWEDLNADNIWDEGEKPLEGVEFSLDGMFAHSVSGGRGTTDAEGQTTIDTWTPETCIGDYTIRAETPEGYLASGETEITMNHNEVASRYEFGFYLAFVECGIFAPIFTWVDANGNGHFDGDELPLEGVEVVIRQISPQIPVGDGISMSDGTGEALAFGTNCADPISLYELAATLPEGYTPTTEIVIQLDEEDDMETPYMFGFQSNP